VPDDAIQRGREIRAGRRQVGRIFLQDRVQRLDGRLARKRPRARQHLVEHDAEREQIRATIHLLAANLFRGHVPGGAEDDASRGRFRGRDRGRGAGVLRTCGPGVLELCEAEVQDLHLAIGQQEDVCGLEVAVRDALAVRGREPARDADRDLHRLAHGQRPLAQPIGERLAVEEFRDDEERVGVEADVEEGEDIRMRERRHRARLAFEAGPAIRVPGDVGRQHLQRDVPAQARVARPVYLPHSARPERPGDFIRAETSAGGQPHPCRGL
jgi:hypothetical protein